MDAQQFCLATSDRHLCLDIHTGTQHPPVSSGPTHTYRNPASSCVIWAYTYIQEPSTLLCHPGLHMHAGTQHPPVSSGPTHTYRNPAPSCVIQAYTYIQEPSTLLCHLGLHIHTGTQHPPVSSRPTHTYRNPVPPCVLYIYICTWSSWYFLRVNCRCTEELERAQARVLTVEETNTEELSLVKCPKSWGVLAVPSACPAPGTHSEG